MARNLDYVTARRAADDADEMLLDEAVTVPDDADDPVLEEVVGELRKHLENAIDFASSEMEPDREKAHKYFRGESDLESDANRSKYVNSKVRDAVRAVKPDLLRVFLSHRQPVEFLPTSIQQAPLARLQSLYTSQVFWRNNGYRMLHDVIHSAALDKIGVAKVYRDERQRSRYACYKGISQQQLMQLENTPDVEVEITAERMVEAPMPMGAGVEMLFQGPQQMRVYDVDVTSYSWTSCTKVEAVPLEEFIIDRNARSADDFRVIGHRREMRRGDVLAMGFDEEELEGLDGESPEEDRAIGSSTQRRGYATEAGYDESDRDETMEDILITEVFYRADLDDTGTAKLYKFTLGGTNYEYLDHERVDDHDFAIFMIDPEPFTVYGHSIFDVTKMDQDVLTSLARAIIDNAHMTNNPRLAVHETLVNIEDVLNNELGAPIRVRGNGQVQPIAVPFTGQGLLPVMENIEKASEVRTGITRANLGLDPNALQSTDKEAVQNTIRQGRGQIALMARNLAETGLARVFRLLLKLSLRNPDPLDIIETTGGYIEAPLQAFDPTLDMQPKVGLGSGSIEERLIAYQKILELQKATMSELGPNNPMVSMSQVYNTIEDMTRLAGIYDVGRHFTLVDKAVEARFAQQVQQQKQADKGIDPAQALVQAEQIKGQARLQDGTTKAQTQLVIEQMRNQTKMLEMQVDNDLKRDEMLQDLLLEADKIRGQYDQAVDVAQIQAAQRSNNGG